MNRVFIKTYGCQMNERDSEAVAAMLRARGYRIVASEDDCDIMLLNTCSVRDAAEQKAISKASHVARERKGKNKRRAPDFVLGILGCMAQNRGAALLDRLPDVDLVIGTQKFHQVPGYLDNLRAAREADVPVGQSIVDIAEEAGSQNMIKDHFDFANASASGTGSQPVRVGWHGRPARVPNVSNEQTAAQHEPMGELPMPRKPTDWQPVPLQALQATPNPDFQNDYRQVTAFVSIQQGCDMGCSFCIVPKTRGDERSRPMDDIVAECRELAARGVREVTLLGQIVTSYGRRDYEHTGGASPFTQLIERVHAIDGIARIRFTSPHPRGFKQDLVDAFAPGRFPKLCEQVHLPMQSGSNRILKAMNRPYSRERYKEIVDSLRAANPGIYFSTDVIVGFPGETDDDFEQTRELFEACNYDMAYIVKYSLRTGTPAATMPNQVPEETKERRNETLLDILRRNSLRRNETLVGTTQEVLVEGRDKRGARHTGRTRGNRVAIFDAPPEAVGSLLLMRVERATVSSLYGTLVHPAAANSEESHKPGTYP